MTLTSESAMEIDQLRKIVSDHAVRFETAPNQVSDTHQLRTIGYDVTLLGRHTGRLAPAISAGCERCEATWRALHRIATAVIPRGAHDSTYEIRPFDRSLHMDPRHHFDPEIELVIEVRHRQGYFEAIDKCESDCLKEISANLRLLGAQARN